MRLDDLQIALSLWSSWDDWSSNEHTESYTSLPRYSLPRNIYSWYSSRWLTSSCLGTELRTFCSGPRWLWSPWIRSFRAEPRWSGWTADSWFRMLWLAVQKLATVSVPVKQWISHSGISPKQEKNLSNPIKPLILPLGFEGKSSFGIRLA